jgi:hypothetical protein
VATSRCLKPNPLTKVFKEIKLTNGSGTVPIQFQYSDDVHGPEGTRKSPAPFAGQLNQVMQQEAG